MIKKIINWIKCLFYREKKDLHLEPDVKVEDIKCTTHYPRYKKSCTVCRAAGEV
jgi:hypothetical protein